MLLYNVFQITSPLLIKIILGPSEKIAAARPTSENARRKKNLLEARMAKQRKGRRLKKVGGDEAKDEPVVYIDAPIPAANPWKKSSLSPEPVAAATASPPAAQNTQIEKDNKSAKPVSW